MTILCKNIAFYSNIGYYYNDVKALSKALTGIGINLLPAKTGGYFLYTKQFVFQCVTLLR